MTDDHVFCGNCGAELKPEAKFCHGCGARQADFDTGEQATTPAPEPPALPVDDLPDTGATVVSERHEPPPARGAPAEAYPGRPSEPAAPTPAQGPPPPPTRSYGHPTPPPPPRQGHVGPPADHGGAQMGQRIEQVVPGVGELATQVRAGLGAPGVATAGVAAGAAMAVTAGLALLLALIFPEEESIIGALNTEGAVDNVMRQICGVLQVPFEGSTDGTKISFRGTPFVFVLAPVLGAAAGAYWQRARTRGMAPLVRMVWGAAAGAPFAFGAMIVAAIGAGGDGDPDVFGAFLLALLWGSVGGAAGMWWSIRQEAPESLVGLVPARGRPVLAIGAAALRSFGAALALTAVVGALVWVIATLADVEGSRSFGDADSRSTVTATVENGLFAVEHGTHFLELGTMASFETGLPFSIFTPVPGSAEDQAKALFDIVEDDSREERIERANESGSFTIFSYGKGYPTGYFVPLLVLIAVPLLGSLYAGFTIGRARAAPTPGLGAAWGALVGPIWALLLVILDALVSKPFSPRGGEFSEESAEIPGIADIALFGQANGDTVFLAMLLWGAAMGAVGGLLAARGAQPAHPSPAAAPSPPPSAPPPPPTPYPPR